MIRPARLMTEKRIAFILFATKDGPRPNFFMAALRLKARTVIHHQRSILPEVARGELPPQEVFLEDGMGFFAFAAPFIGKSDKALPCPVHIRDEAMELILRSFTIKGLEGKLHAGKDGLSKAFPDGEVAVEVTFLGVGQFGRDIADLRPFPAGIESLPFFGRDSLHLFLESIGHRALTANSILPKRALSPLSQ